MAYQIPGIDFSRVMVRITLVNTSFCEHIISQALPGLFIKSICVQLSPRKIFIILQILNGFPDFKGQHTQATPDVILVVFLKKLIVQ